MRGIVLARAAQPVFERRRAAYPHGITVGELERELRLAGITIDGDDPHRTLADALNASQVDHVWARQDDARWLAGDGNSARLSGLSGVALAMRSTTSFVSAGRAVGSTARKRASRWRKRESR